MSTEYVHHLSGHDVVANTTSGVVVHGCNAQMVQNSGIARQLRDAYPIVYASYRTHCAAYPTPASRLGTVDIVRVKDGLWVANCITQLHYGRDGAKYASPAAIATSLNLLYQRIIAGDETPPDMPVYMPLIGCGLGGLDWEADVAPIVSAVANATQIHTYVCER